MRLQFEDNILFHQVAPTSNKTKKDLVQDRDLMLLKTKFESSWSNLIQLNISNLIQLEPL